MRTITSFPAGVFAGRGTAPGPARAVTAQPPTADPQWALDYGNPLRRVGFYFTLGLIFVRFSMLNDLLTYVLHVNLYLLYLTTIPALIGFVASGGIRRSLQSKPVLLWCGFVAWMIVCVPFSVWKGASAGSLFVYIRTVLPILFLTGGLAMTWQECRAMVYTIAIAGAFNAAASAIFLKDGGSGRFGTGFTGTIGNPNDLAAHLLFMLPYFIFWAVAGRVPFAVRLLGWPALGLGLFWILASGSRGALLALLVAAGLLLLRLRPTQSVAALGGGALLVLLLLPAVPRSVLNRALSVFGEHEGTAMEQREADESARVRKRLLRRSIEFSLQHPVFGVGPFQFGTADGVESKPASGGAYTERSLWLSAHNSFLAVSAESGLPAFGCFIGALVLTWLHIRRAARLVKQRPGLSEIAAALSCFEISLLSFSAAIFFANFSYYFHLPTVVGMGSLLARAAVREASLAQPADAAAPAHANGAAPPPAAAGMRPRGAGAGPAAKPPNRFLRPGGRRPVRG
jgi:hypothetical protein